MEGGREGGERDTEAWKQVRNECGGVEEVCRVTGRIHIGGKAEAEGGGRE